MIIEALNLRSIRGRLWFGFGVLVAMLVVAGMVARRSFAGISETITQSLAEVQEESQHISLTDAVRRNLGYAASRSCVLIILRLLLLLACNKGRGEEEFVWASRSLAESDDQVAEARYPKVAVTPRDIEELRSSPVLTPT